MGSSIDTIFALSSAPGRAGVSVFRLSGSKAFSIARSIIGQALPKVRVASLRKVFDGKLIIDEVLLLRMLGPNSFTGEDTVEFQGHGSLAVIEAMSSLLSRSGARQADAGEFTRRAVLNGRMDLTEAEGLADLIDSETEGQRRQAIRQMQGSLKSEYEVWRSNLIEALAYIEGEIDFPDEGDVPDALGKKAEPPLKIARERMRELLQTVGKGERVRAGLNIAVIGAPNAGKSSLVNRLSGRDAAIVSAAAGTTRDIIDVQMVIGGLPVKISDTAGLRVSGDEIEAEGVKRALWRAEESDIRLFVSDKSVGVSDRSYDIEPRKGDAMVFNKIDKVKLKTAMSLDGQIKCFSLSAKTGEGVEALEDWLAAEIVRRFGVDDMPGLTRVRHESCVRNALTSVERALSVLSKAPELAGEDLRSALRSIQELAGETDMEAVFDQIFLRFCIGK